MKEVIDNCHDTKMNRFQLEEMQRTLLQLEGVMM